MRKLIKRCLEALSGGSKRAGKPSVSIYEEILSSRHQRGRPYQDVHPDRIRRVLDHGSRA